VSVRCKEIVKLLSCEASPHNNAWEMSAKRKEMVTSHAKNDSPEKWRADCWRNIPISLIDKFHGRAGFEMRAR
jgi:hypothetical protein